jgi:putative membrane protein
MKQRMGWALLAAIAVVSACKEDDNTLATIDRNFFMNASEAHKAEVDAGQVAIDKGTAQEVKDFGARMVSEHNTAMAELQTLATQKNASVAANIDLRHQALKLRLANYTGYTYDTAYINNQVKDHESVISMFQQYEANGKDQDLKNYATKNLPQLQDHLAKAMEIKAMLDQAVPATGRKE